METRVNCNYGTRVLQHALLEFYQEIFSFWSEFKLADKNSEMLVWNNKHLLIDGKSNFCSKLYNISFVYIGYLFTDDNRSVPFEQVIAKRIDSSICI